MYAMRLQVRAPSATYGDVDFVRSFSLEGEAIDNGLHPTHRLILISYLSQSFSGCGTSCSFDKLLHFNSQNVDPTWKYADCN